MKNVASGQPYTFVHPTPNKKSVVSYVLLKYFRSDRIPTQLLEQLRGYEQNLFLVISFLGYCVFIGDVLLVCLSFVSVPDA